MARFTAEERTLAEAVARLAYTNPFLPERIELERAVLGDAFADSPPVWSVRAELTAQQNPNLERLDARVAALVGELQSRLATAAARSAPNAADRDLYEDLVLYHLYQRYAATWWEMIEKPEKRRAPAASFEAFRRDVDALLAVPGAPPPTVAETAHLFACFYQLRRAFHFIFWHVIGGSMPMARLRAQVWQSIFTHDVRRYRRALFDRMGDVTTLVVGPSGTGKELVAQAIALSRYIPYDVGTGRFAEDFATVFHPLNLSALAPTLIESELFGHRRGAFTGATQDRAGWLEQCSPFGTVFLDEVGDVDAGVQVKLLRVLQSRSFERLGDTEPRRFRGKIIAATNRDLAAEIRGGRFRQDFYYRLCSDIVRTPSLAEQLAATPAELGNLVQFLAQRLVGDQEATRLASEVLAWIEGHLGSAYPWPGNVRELEQCVRNVLVRGEYHPLDLAPTPAPRSTLLDAVEAGTLTADELLTGYCARVYAETGSYLETARRLGLDRRTVRARVGLGRKAEA